MNNPKFRLVSFSMLSIFIFFILLLTNNCIAQQITASYELNNINTKGYASVLIPSSFPVNTSDEEVMAVGSLLDPANPNSIHSALHLVKYNNQGLMLLNKVLDDPNADERAVSICVFNNTFVILSSYRNLNLFPAHDKAKLTFVNLNGDVISEEYIEIPTLNGAYDNLYPMHEIVYNSELYICGVLQKGSTFNSSTGFVGLDFSMPKAGFVYKYNSNQIATIDPPQNISSGQKYTLAKRLRISDGNLYVLGMYDMPYTSSSGITTNAPYPFFAEVNTTSQNYPTIPISNYKVLNNGLFGCASDIISGQLQGEFLLLSQGLTNQNFQSDPTVLAKTTGVHLSYIYSNNSLYKQKNLTLRDNQTATSMFPIPFTNLIVLAGLEQCIGGFNYNTWGGSLKRDNAFLYEVSYVFNPTSFSVSINNFNVFNNYFNSTDSYDFLGGNNMSGFYFLPDNTIEREPFTNGYIINTLYKNKQPSGYFHGLKTIFTNGLLSCDVIQNPYIQTPVTINTSISSSITPINIPLVPNGSITINNVSCNGAIFNFPNYFTEICDNGGKYKIASKKSDHLNSAHSIFPNPSESNSKIYINIEGCFDNNSQITLSLYNIFGLCLDSKKIFNLENLLTFNLPILNSGIYYLTLKTENSKQISYPILIK